jgi:hypothetical protein
MILGKYQRKLYYYSIRPSPPVLRQACFFASRDDFELPKIRSLTVAALFAACPAVGQAILPAAAFQAALGCGSAALLGRTESCAPVGNRRRTGLYVRLGRRATNLLHS